LITSCDKLISIYTLSMEVIEVYKCKNCSAPSEYTPDSVVIKCNYCGYYEY